MNTINVGERNTAFVDGVPQDRTQSLWSRTDVLEIYPRKVCFFPTAAASWSSAWLPSNPEQIVLAGTPGRPEGGPGF